MKDFTLCMIEINDKQKRPQAKTQGPGAGWGFNELNQEVRHRQGDWGHSLDHPPCSDKSQNSGFLRKSIFLILGGS